MGTCALVDELNRLRKSSGDSIDNEKSFEAFKQYMHIQRNVEDDLRVVLRNIAESHRKTLVLLCGSAGDGKSHMLSYLKNYDTEHLLSGFHIHNDATESSAPTKTAIETLSEVLRDFTDDRIQNDGENLILAINLGVLNNFIESEYGKQYTLLKQYVEDHSILSTKVVDTAYDKESPIQHVSFSDYQMYTLTEHGAESNYIEAILGRIFNSKEENPFYKAYCNGCQNCSLQTKCPVRYNYQFLQNNNVQKYIAKLVVMTIIKKKDIVTTREMLNYFYDITVPQDFNYSEYGKYLTNNDELLKLFLKGITPHLVFGQDGVSSLMDHVKENDPVLYRDEDSDDYAVEYYVSTDVSDAIRSVIEGTAYAPVMLDSENLHTMNIDKTMKSFVFSHIIRLKSMCEGEPKDQVYDDFVKQLYYFNAGKKRNLGGIYKAVQTAVLQWCGKDAEGHACLEQGNHKYALFEDIKFEIDTSVIPSMTDKEELQRFMPVLKVGFLDKNAKSLAPLEIDFPLYRMIRRLNEGYMHTVNDANNHADFIGFIEQMLQVGNSVNEVFIVEKNGRTSVLKKTELGYEFEVKR